MNKKYLLMLLTLVLLFIIFISLNIIKNPPVIFNPQGYIAMQEKSLIQIVILLGLTIIVPTILALYFIAWKYRAGNTKAQYSPDLTGSNVLKILWWAIPTVAMFILAIIAWKATHQLDPYKPIDSAEKPIIIQVVALDWKWLFIYPEQNIATINFIQFPVNTPVNLTLTADAPMNSFWIPSLSGQIYAMSAMETKLHLIANKPGDYQGGAAEINGAGYAGMKFTARVRSKNDFDAWVKSVQASSKPLDLAEYKKLSKPSEYNPWSFYSPVSQGLYNGIVMKFMTSTDTTQKAKK